MDDYLSHYGVLGMKWGHRNAETRARYRRDGKRLSKKERFMRDAKQAMKDDPEVAKAAKSYRRATRYEKQYSEMPYEKQAKYIVKAADESYKRAHKKYGDSVGTKQQFRDFYLNEDGDQGQGDSFTQYLSDLDRKGVVNAKKYAANRDRAASNYVKTAERKAQELVKDYSDHKIIKLGKQEQYQTALKIFFDHENDEVGWHVAYRYDPYND